MELPVRVLSRSPKDTRSLGLRLGRQVPRGTVLALQGVLGTGKTTLVQGVAEALHVRDAVTSPSFTLVSEYEGSRPEGPFTLYHVDLYRLAATRELYGIGLEDILSEAAVRGLAAIEWAERAEELLGEEAFRGRTVWVRFALRGDGARDIRVHSGGEPPA